MLIVILAAMKLSPILFVIALVFVVIVLSDLFLWFAVSRNIIDPETARQEYLSYYPIVLQNARVLTVISLLMLSFSGYVFLNASKSNKNRSVAIILGLLSTLLLMAKIYSFTRR